MKEDRYLLPLINDLLDAPCKARIYTKINLQHAYHLICITDGDKWKTTFQTQYRSFKWLVMPEGLTNAPAGFQRFMNNIFADIIDISVVVYLDDILVYCYAPCWGYPSPGFGLGRTQSSDGCGFSEQVAAPTRLSRPGFQSQTEGSSRGAMARRAERREATSAEWAVFHGDDIR